MKKVIVILFLISSFCFANDYKQFSSINSAKKTFGGNLASLSGFNSLTRNVIESILQKEIKNETNSKFKIKINNFYGTNILNGEFKSIKASAKKYEYDGIYLSNLNIQTLCPYNRVLFENEVLYFIENMVLKFSANLSENELNKTLNSGKLNKNLSKILRKASKYNGFYSVINSFLPIEFPIKIDENNQGKLKIQNISKNNEVISFYGLILIKKNK